MYTTLLATEFFKALIEKFHSLTYLLANIWLFIWEKGRIVNTECVELYTIIDEVKSFDIVGIRDSKVPDEYEYYLCFERVEEAILWRFSP